MSPKSSRIRVLSFLQVLLLVSQVVAAAAASAGEPEAGPILSPSWRFDLLGRVQYNYMGDQRKGEDLWRYRVNEEGRIEGQDFLSIVWPAGFDAFSRTLKMRGVVGSAARLYEQYLQQLSRQGMGILTLARILDHEAMKRKLKPQVSRSRVNYVLRSILVQNAANARKILVKEVVVAGGKVELHPAQDISSLSNATLYAWLTEGVGANTMTINMDWKYREGGVQADWNEVSFSQSELKWPAVSLHFDKLPLTWQGMSALITQQLQDHQTRLTRQMMFERLVQEKNGALSLQTLFGISSQQVDTLYQTLKDRTFRLSRYHSGAHDLLISGDRATEFKSRFLVILAEKEKQSNADFKVLPGEIEGGESPIDRQKRLLKHADELRDQVPLEIVNQLMVGEFADDLASGRLNVRVGTRDAETLSPAAASSVSTASSIDQKIDAALLNPMFAGTSLFPVLNEVLQDHSIRVVVLKKIEELSPIYLDPALPQVREFLRRKISARLIAKAYRRTAYDLLSENPVAIVNQICGQPEWPCLDTNAKLWTEAMFPEILYPGMTLPESSTLLDEQHFDRVLDISTDSLRIVFQAPNAPVVSDRIR